MERRTLVVGDVHGCLDELARLLRTAGFAKGDRLAFVGDLVAKGPDSAGVLALCREYAALAVLGNHDAHLLAGHHKKTAKTLKAADLAWLAALPPYLELPELGALVVHGGLVPGVPLEKQDRELMLNMRSFDAKGRPSMRIEGGTPWAARWPGPWLVVFGHDALRGLQQHGHAFGLDTGCVYGGALTALWLPERRLVAVKARRVWQEPGSL